MVRQTWATCLVVAAIALSGCGSQSAVTRTPGDPFERMNRRIFAFNNALDRSVSKPVARTYKVVTPQFVRTGISNFVGNLSYPAVIMNDVLQLKGKPTLRDTGRFLVNTTVGVAGFFDPATSLGLIRNNEDLGQTLGRWGVGSGPYLILPFGGATTLRDGLARIGDPFTTPLAFVDDSNAARYGLRGMRLLNSRSKLLDVEAAFDNVYDQYAVLRSVYLQRRAYLVHDGNIPEPSFEEELLEDDFVEEEVSLAEQMKLPRQLPEPPIPEPFRFADLVQYTQPVTLPSAPAVPDPIQVSEVDHTQASGQAEAPGTPEHAPPNVQSKSDP
jgi:phospholipid-binding lipoprotein MlaA